MVSDPKNEQGFSELSDYIESLPDRSSALIAVLHKAQEIFGYLPREVQEYIAKELNHPVSEVNGVVTFYSYFTESPTGRHVISVCMGTACFVKGSAGILEEFERVLGIKCGETTEDGRFTLNLLRCVGACGLAPVVTVGDKVYGHFTKQMVETTLAEYND